MPDEDDLPAPAGAKGWADPRPWSDVEAAFLRALSAVDSRFTPSTEFGLTLSYVPYSSLGQQEGVDLSWEVMITASGQEVQQYELAGHPASVLDVVADQASSDLAPVVAAEVVARWVGWAPLLRRVAHAVCQLPPDEAGLNVTVYRKLVAGAQRPRWCWSVEIPVPGEQWPASEWSGDTPSRALQGALDEAQVWLSGRPAGHLLISDDELLDAGEELGNWS